MLAKEIFPGKLQHEANPEIHHQQYRAVQLGKDRTNLGNTNKHQNDHLEARHHKNWKGNKDQTKYIRTPNNDYKQCRNCSELHSNDNRDNENLYSGPDSKENQNSTGNSHDGHEKSSTETEDILPTDNL